MDRDPLIRGGRSLSLGCHAVEDGFLAAVWPQDLFMGPLVWALHSFKGIRSVGPRLAGRVRIGVY